MDFIMACVSITNADTITVV